MSLGTPAVNLHAPGPIGDTTPATVAGTTLTLNPATSGKTLVINTSDFARINVAGGFSDLIIEFNGSSYYEINTSSLQLNGNTVVAFNRSVLATFQCYTLPGGAGITAFASGVGGLSCVQFGAEVLTWSATAITITPGVNLIYGGVTIPAISKDTGWTANADAGSKTSAIPSSATLATIQTAMNLAVAGSGDALAATAAKVKAIESALALAAPLLPNV